MYYFLCIFWEVVHWFGIIVCRLCNCVRDVVKVVVR